MKTKDNASIKENSILKDYESKREKVVRGGMRHHSRLGSRRVSRGISEKEGRALYEAEPACVKA